ncbi:hypothetical protein Pmani_006709 [Petrolisthes manimaculis]|uniref:G-protein coupled receptors family 1 profile domain-containing protein n=1 Tax=Petrolisthes manimaculis TaxID=1843537 RepID=A0AAE1QAP1_9EUCA|nr:hypothetical protein Pmani_006709 [Petrolisthes manimaculis]
MKEMSFRHRTPAIKPKLTERHRELRLQFAQRYDEENVYQVACSGRETCNVWGWIFLHGVGEVTEIECRFTSDTYLEILEEVMLPSVRSYALPWSQGLLFHQALVDCARAAILIPLGRSIYSCLPVTKCSLVETAFLLLVTVSTINMLTTVLSQVKEQSLESRTNHTFYILEDHKQTPLLMESPQCVLFGTFMIWFASITINLGPTFLSGALAANIHKEHNTPSCPLITGPLRHYVLNVLWIVTNVLVLLLTVYHLYKLYRDLSTSSIEAVRIASLVTTLISVTQPQNQADPEAREHRQVNNYITRMEKEGVERVKMFLVVTVAYVVFWGPLFLVTLFTPSGDNTGLGHELE